LVETLFVKKIDKISKTQCNKIRLKILYRYRDIIKNENISLTYDVNDHVYSRKKNLSNLDGFRE